MDTFWQVVGALVPSVGVGLVFWFVMRAIVGADRRERAALARLEAAEDRAAALAATAPGHAAPPAAEAPAATSGQKNGHGAPATGPDGQRSGDA